MAPFGQWMAEAITRIEGLSLLSGNNSANVTVEVIEAVTRGISDVMQLAATTFPAPASSSAVEAGDAVRSAINAVVGALLKKSATSPVPTQITSPALNISVKKAESATMSFASSGAADTSIQLPAGLASGLAGGVPITVAMWTTPLSVHGGALNASDTFSGPTVSFSLFVNGSSVTQFTEPLLMALPVATQDETATNCIGQPTARDLLESMKDGASRCEATLECKYWDIDTLRWSSDGCRTVKLNTTAGAVGCECNHLTDFISIKVPVQVTDDAVEVLSLDPIQRAAVHCRCTKELEAVLVKLGNESSSRDLNLTLTKPGPGADYPDFTAWSAAVVSSGTASLVTLPRRQGTMGEGVPVRLSAASLAETPGGSSHAAKITVSVSVGDLPTAECSNITVVVKASVLAVTVASRTAWGWAPQGMPCAAAGPAAEGVLPDWTLPMALGEERTIAFTACDFEGLAVSHALPTARKALPDPRSFSAALIDVPSGNTRDAAIISNGGGRYTVVVRATALGQMRLALRLGVNDTNSADATPWLGALEVHVRCPTGLVPHPSQNTCTCDVGSEPDGLAVVVGGPPLLCKTCERGRFKPWVGGSQCKACAAGSVQPDVGGSTCPPCAPGTFQPSEGRSECRLCATRTTSVPPYTSCSGCDSGFVRSSGAVAATQESCRPCHPLATCPLNSTTLATMQLRPGAWRLSPFSHMLETCGEARGTSPCTGGRDAGADGAGYCRTGHSGLRCEICLEGAYFSAADAQCAQCLSVASYLFVYVALLGVPTLTILALREVKRRQFPLRLAATLRKVEFSTTRSALLPKVRILIGFAQIAGAAKTYSIGIPRTLRGLLAVLSWLELDIWGEQFLPHACAGGYLVYLLLTACFPLLVLLGTGIAMVSRRVWRQQRKADGALTARVAFGDGLLDALTPLLVVVTVLCPTVSAAAFGAMHCRQVVSHSDPLENRAFLWASPAIECDSQEAADLRWVATAVLIVWSAGSLVGLAALLVKIRGPVTQHSPTDLSSAAKVVWGDYRIGLYWWGLVEHARRLVLTGLLVFIPESAVFIRLMTALLFCLGCMIAQPLLKPYARTDVGALSMAEQVVSFVLILGYSFLYLYERFEVFLPAAGDETSAVSLVLAFGSTGDIAVLIVLVVSALAAAIAVAILSQWLQGTQNRDFVLMDTGLQPRLTIWREHKFHLFLSHVSVLLVYVFRLLISYTHTTQAELRAERSSAEALCGQKTRGCIEREEPAPPV